VLSRIGCLRKWSMRRDAFTCRAETSRVESRLGRHLVEDIFLSYTLRIKAHSHQFFTGLQFDIVAIRSSQVSSWNSGDSGVNFMALSLPVLHCTSRDWIFAEARWTRMQNAYQIVSFDAVLLSSQDTLSHQQIP